MKRIFKYLLYALGLIVFIMVAFLGWILLTKPNVGAAKNMVIQSSQEKVDRGAYLANHVMLCMDCHSVRDFSLYSGPPTPGTEGIGGEVFDQSMGFPGRFISSNITPGGIGDWTDGELFRLITTGVKRDGNPIFPVMPYESFGKLDPEDIESVIAYLRTLPAINTNHPPSNADFPMNIILRTIPHEAEMGVRPDPSNTVEYGKYMVTAAACGECHTRFEKGAFTGEFLAGGREFGFPDGSILHTPNLTPHLTGLGEWTKDRFINEFKKYTDSSYVHEPVQPGQMQTIMPWIMYAGMEEEDLGAIYDYLQSLDPVDNDVVKFTPPPPQ